MLNLLLELPLQFNMNLFGFDLISNNDLSFYESLPVWEKIKHLEPTISLPFQESINVFEKTQATGILKFNPPAFIILCYPRWFFTSCAFIRYSLFTLINIYTFSFLLWSLAKLNGRPGWRTNPGIKILDAFVRPLFNFANLVLPFTGNIGIAAQIMTIGLSFATDFIRKKVMLVYDIEFDYKVRESLHTDLFSKYHTLKPDFLDSPYTIKAKLDQIQESSFRYGENTREFFEKLIFNKANTLLQKHEQVLKEVEKLCREYPARESKFSNLEEGPQELFLSTHDEFLCQHAKIRLEDIKYLQDLDLEKANKLPTSYDLIIPDARFWPGGEYSIFKKDLTPIFSTETIESLNNPPFISIYKWFPFLPHLELVDREKFIAFSDRVEGLVLMIPNIRHWSAPVLQSGINFGNLFFDNAVFFEPR